jgi:hypothetical protein
LVIGSEMLSVPDMDEARSISRSQQAAVGGPSEGEQAVLVLTKGDMELTGGRVPELDCRVTSGGGQQAAIWRPSESEDLVIMAGVSMDHAGEAPLG